MKHAFFTALFIAIGINASYAQTNRYDWGIEGGPNLSTFRITDNNGLDPKPVIRASGGFVFQYNTPKILSFKTGFSYQRKGFKQGEFPLIDINGNQMGSAKMDYSFDYISLPILVKASFGKEVKFFVNAGPYAGFLLGVTERAFINDKLLDKNKPKSGFENFDFGVAGGIGVAIPIKDFWMVHAEIRNYTGLKNINALSGSQLYTNTTDLRVGVVYRLGFY